MKKITLLLAIITLSVIKLNAQLTLPYTFENNSRYADEDIYIGLVGKMEPTGDVWMNITNSSLVAMSADDNTVDGPEWSEPAGWKYPDIFTKLSEVTDKKILIPHGLYACRIFISFESPMYLRFHETGGYAGANLNSESDPNDGIRWELVELTWGDAGLWTNTSRVDAYQYPMGLEVNGFSGGVTGETYEESYNEAVNGNGTPQFKKIGELLSHDEILAAWDENVSTDYLVAKTIKTHSYDGEPIIEQPSKVDEFPKDVLDTYIDDIWETYSTHDLHINIGDRGTWVGRVNNNNQFVFTDPADGTIATIYDKPTTVNAIEGSGYLAYTPHDASVNTEAYNEDLMIQAQMAAAISRHAIYTSITDETVQYSHDATRFFQIEPYNEYVRFFHDDIISFESQTYAFAYDDVGDHSSTIQSTFPTEVKVIIGGYSEDNVLSTSETLINDGLMILYPNPTNGNNITLSGLKNDFTINIYTIEGKLIKSEEAISTKNIQIETSNLTNGLYLAEINSKDNKYTKTFKFLIN
ncbi:beta-1,3-glucanase family protein [uncultured Aquimarina sp.]|uniref:beta-1,3-glucanase family protein n=1 Tax=uncultured Aquimarina sp. TaxID=575652 RepID=UPI00263188B1|nr:beta-1,3-glucanase family protein [uncultured Aquimarina sp.]